MPLIYEMLKESSLFTVINLNGEKAYIEGVIKLLSVTRETVALLTKKATVTVEGKALMLSELDDGSVTISGDIVAIRTEKNEKK